MALCLLDVVSEGLLLNAGADHLLLIFSELLIRNRWATSAVALGATTMVSFAIEIFLKVLGVSQGSGPIEIGLQSSFHIWKLALHA